MFHDREEMSEQRERFLAGLSEDRFDEIISAHPRGEDADYIGTKLTAILDRIPEIDAVIDEASEGWRTSRMSKADLSLLRLAVYEVRFDDEVPTGVAINEAVEIAKKYGGDRTASFVNGILGKIATETKP